MKRRYFLLGTGALALSQIAGCQNSSTPILRVRLLKNSIPAQLLNEFRQSLQQPVKLDFVAEAQLNTFYSALEQWQQPTKAKSGFNLPFTQPNAPIIPDFVTLGNYWLTAAIQKQLIQSFEPNNLSQWTKLPPKWQQLVTRDNQVWAAPYRWSSTVIAYRRDKFKSLGWTPTDWGDLWREELRDRISLLAQPREVIGLTLKKLGYSYNTTALNQVSNLKAELQKLHQQVKFYSSNTYLQPLLLQDTWLTVGWSTDILRMMKRDPQIAVVIPKSGTALSADLWVRPKGTTSSTTKQLTPLQSQWLDFCWQPKIANQISLFTEAASPLLFSMQSSEVPQDLRNHPLLYPDQQILDKSEFIEPLSNSATEQYRDLWQEIRSSG